ncbi:thiol reductant ABC exporter subunit CydC [Paenalcaligenes sp. Me131]|uniref:thiol reductant ABC exporter subunit CydC n=1 Tax=Paenalcaligenes sp. Me131 TaxID=3392636 RepID=UPI003D27C4DA
MTLWWGLCRDWLVRRRWLVVGSILVALGTVVAGVGLLAVAGWFLTGAFLAASMTSFNLFGPSALVRGLSMWRIASRYVERIAGHTVTLELQAEIRAQTFAQLMQLPPSELAKYRDGDLVARLVNDVERLDSVYLLLVVPTCTALLGGGMYALLTGSQMPWGGVALALVILIAAVLVPYVVARRAAAGGMQLAAQVAQARSVLHDTIAAHVDVVVFNATDKAQARFEQLSQALSKQREKLAAMASLGSLWQQCCMALTLVALVVIGLDAYSKELLTGPMWVGLLLGALGLFEIMAPLMRGAAGLGVASAAASRLGMLRSVDEKMPSGSTPLPDHGVLFTQGLRVGFDVQVPLLKDVTLHIPQGGRCLIRGVSGSGKTTLLQTLMGVQPALVGQVLYGDVDVQQSPTDQRFQRFALLSQHSTVFMGSLRYNLTLGCAQATDEQLWDALQRVRLADFVRSLPDGLDSWIGEGGNTLSTGQARRVCLARIVLAPASVWFLDEPTSGLDRTNAHALLQDVLQFAGTRSVIMVSHDEVPEGCFEQEWQVQGDTLQQVS